MRMMRAELCGICSICLRQAGQSFISSGLRPATHVQATASRLSISPRTAAGSSLLVPSSCGS